MQDIRLVFVRFMLLACGKSFFFLQDLDNYLDIAQERNDIFFVYTSSTVIFRTLITVDISPAKNKIGVGDSRAIRKLSHRRTLRGYYCYAVQERACEVMFCYYTGKRAQGAKRLPS